MIYLVTYLSNGLRVKGYLCLPTGFDLGISELQDLISGYYYSPAQPDGSQELPVTEIAGSIQRDNKDIRLYKLPVFIYCRGGIGKVGRVKTDWMQQFANHGHIVFAPCYRGNQGGEGRDEFGGDDKEDVFAAYRLLQSWPFVDPDRISVMGFSRGSINATQTAVEMPGVRSLILWGGVSDLTQTYEERIDLRRMLKRVIGGTPAKKPEAYANRSPLKMAERIQCPVLIMHGEEDQQVDISHGQNMYNRLLQLKKRVDMHRYDGYGHHLPPQVFAMAVQRMFDWIGCQQMVI